MKDLEKLWSILNDYNISRLIFKIQENDKVLGRYETIGEKLNNNSLQLKKGAITREFVDEVDYFLFGSPCYTHFAVNINRAVSFYPEIIKMKRAEEYFETRNLFIFHSIYILLITALESYLAELFRNISKKLLVSDLDLEYKQMKDFLNKFNIRDKFLLKVFESNNLNFSLSDILPKALDFQQKEKVKMAYKLIDMNVAEIDNTLWDRIFSKTHGYIKKRNDIVHKGLENIIEVNNINDLDLDKEIEEIESAIIDIVQFVFYVETLRFFNVPEDWEFGVVVTFPQKQIKSSIKKRIIELNYNALEKWVEILYERGNIDASKEFLEMLREFKSVDSN